MENAYFSMEHGIAIAIALGVLFIVVIVLAAVAYNNWKKLLTANASLTENVQKLCERLTNTDEALTKTQSELKAVDETMQQNEAQWKEQQKKMLFARHKIFLSNMETRLGEMREEIKINGVRGVLDEKEMAILDSQYSGAETIIKNVKL